MITRHTFRARAAIAALVALFVTLPWTASAQMAEVTITSPAAGASLRGTTTVSASVSGLGGLTVVGVQFKVDGANLGAEDTSSPYSIPWNTTQSSNGSHTLTAVARTLLGAQHASGPVTVTVDNLPPAVTINQAAGQADPATASPVNFTVVFSESITGFAATDVAISGTAGGTKTVVVSGGPSTFNVAVSGATSGTVIATIAGGAAQDAAGNVSLASTSTDNTVTLDTIPPTVTINQAAGQADPTNASPINFTVAFSEPITGFAATDVAISGTAGGNKTVLVTGGPSTFNVAVSGATDGTVIATIGGGAAQDAAGNGSIASTSTDNTVTFDATPPSVTINQAAGQADPTNASPINFTAVFSEPVSGFAAGDVAISGTAGGTKTVVVSGGPSTFNVAVSGATSGTVIATIAAGAAQDAVGSSSVASTSTDNTVSLDATPPSVTINQAAGQADPTNASPINFTVVFSEPVTGFAAADVAISGTAGGSKTAVVSGGPSTFNVAVSGATSGTVIATVAGGAALDAAGNSSVASTSTDNTVSLDTTPPTVTINQAASQADPTNASPINFTVIFSEPVTGFAAGDVAISGTAGGSKTVVVSGGPSMFNVAVSGATSGTVIATIVGGAALDAVGNASTASTSTDNQVVVETTTGPPPPSTPDLAAASDSGVSNADNITKNPTPTFTGTAEAGSTVKIFSDGAQVGTGVAGGGTYSIITSPLSDGVHSITATATNSSNQVSSPSTPLSVTIDAASPAVAMTAPGAGATVSGIVAVTANASDGIGVVGVQFQLNAVNLATEITAAPYSTAWDTAATANGSHTLTAIARDAAGNTTTSSPVTVTVANTASVVRVEDTSGSIAFTPSTTWMLGYTGGFAWSGGTAALGYVAGQRATFAFSGTGISWIGLRGPQTGIATVHLDGALVATVDAYSPQQLLQAVLFSVSDLPLGTHTLAIEVTRTKNDASSDYYVVVDAFDVTGGTASPDTTPPLVTITAPTHQSTVVGTTSIQANASDNVHVAGVRFFVDGGEIGDDTAAPYAMSWNSTTYPDGPHTLTAVARDDAGNTTTSPSVTVNVVNTTPPPAATATRFENSDLAIVYTDGLPAAGRPHRWWHGSRSRNWSADISSFNRSAGARAAFRFNGTSVRWIGFRSYWAGIARVSVDGGPFTEIDLFIPPCTFEQRLQGCRDEEPQTVVFTASGLAPGVEHTLFIESTGTKHGGEACTPSITCSQDYAVVVDAIDVGPAHVAPVAGTRSDDSAASYAGTWSQDADPARAWNAGSAAVSGSAGSSIAFTFTGTTVSWIGLRGPATGIARIYLDGALEQEIDTYSPVEASGIIFTATSLAVGSHTIRIEATGTRSTKSTGNSIYVDAIDVRTRIEDLDPSVVFTTPGGGTWALENVDKAWSGGSANVGTGTAARSLTAGARAEFTFNGTGVSWIGMRGPSSGLADVYLDGAFVSRVDLYSATEQVQAVLLSLTDLAAGQHTLRIDVVGDKNAASSSTIVMVDAFDVVVTLPQLPVTRSQDSAAGVVYSGTWVTGARFSYWSGEFATLSQTAGAQATFTFSGTSIRWIGERRRSGGIARVYLDGAFVADVDTYWWLQDEFQATLFSRTGLTPGTHTLTIEVTGQKRGGPDCTGAPSPTCSAGVDIVVDAFDVQ
jgi:hypothetical protein